MASENIRQHMARAMSLVRQGKYADAERLYLKISNLDAQNETAWFMLGAIYFEWDNKHRSIECMQSALACNDGNSEAHFTLGKLFSSQNNLSQAIYHLEKVTEIDVNRGDAWMALGSLLADSGNLIKAELASRKALGLLPNVNEVKVNLANCLISMQTPEGLKEAEVLCDLVRSANPANAGLWQSLGLAYQSLGKMTEAALCLEQTIKRDAKNANALCSMAETHLSMGKLSSCRELLRKSLQLNSENPTAYFHLGKVLLPISSSHNEQLLVEIQHDHVYKNPSDAIAIANQFASNFVYGDSFVDNCLIRFFNEFDPKQVYDNNWWQNELNQFGDRSNAPDTALRSIFSAVFSWSLPTKQVLEKIFTFADGSIDSYGSGTGYWEWLLSTKYNIQINCYDQSLMHRFMPTVQTRHGEAALNNFNTLLLAWIPGVHGIDAEIESLLNQVQSGQKLILIGEPEHSNGQPRTCGTQRFFQYLRTDFSIHEILPLPNYAYFTDRVELLIKN